MIERKQCLGPDELGEYLYGEVDVVARRRIEEHVRACSGCAEEIQSLQQVRGTLASWVPPEVALGFRMISDEDATVASTAGIVGWWRPALGFAAAAVIIVGIMAALARPQIELGPDSMVVRIGWGDSSVGGPVREEGAESRRSDPSLIGGVARSNGETIGASFSNTPPLDIHLVPVDVVDEAEWLHRVQDLIRESERRQSRVLLDRVRQVEQRFEAQRQADLSEMERTFEEVDPEDAALARQQLLEYMRRISR
jgi:hypothetical protein